MEEKTTMDDFKEELEASFQDTQENDVGDFHHVGKFVLIRA